MDWLAFVFGLALLVFGAGLLVRCASTIGRRLGISPLVIGLTIVAFGTSAPELAVSIQGALEGQSDVALGNVVGSNIFNVLFILGIAALITPLLVDRKLIRQEIPWLVAVSMLTLLLALDGRIGTIDGIILVALLLLYTLVQARQARREPMAENSDDPLPQTGWLASTPVQWLGVLAGFALLVLGADLLVNSAIRIARSLGISEVTIGLTIIAAGTSLPEVATSIVAAVRGERDIAVGNVIGSNLFNLMAVAGIASIVSPDGLLVAPSLLAFDLPVMVVLAIACVPVMFSAGRIDRWEGAVFLLYYVAYTTYLVLYTQQHDALDDFTFAMVWVVIPLTLMTAVVIYSRSGKSRR
jgi:cation:H+ antiporter